MRLVRAAMAVATAMGAEMTERFGLKWISPSQMQSSPRASAASTVSKLSRNASVWLSPGLASSTKTPKCMAEGRVARPREVFKAGLQARAACYYPVRSSPRPEEDRHALVPPLHRRRRPVPHRADCPRQEPRLGQGSVHHADLFPGEPGGKLPGLAPRPAAAVRDHPVRPARDWSGRRIEAHLRAGRRAPRGGHHGERSHDQGARQRAVHDGHHSAPAAVREETSMATRILFAPKQADAVMEIARRLTPPGFELVVADIGSPEFYEAAPTVEFYLGLARQMGGEFFRSASKLKLVQLLSAGYDHVDIEAARKAGVPVSNNGGANAIAVAEHTVMLMLAVEKRLVRFHNDVAAGKWRAAGKPDETRVYELAGRTLGIVGLGNIGKKVARRAAAFDMKIQYYDVVRLTEDQEDAMGARFVLFDELLRTSDVVSLHVPLTDSTRQMMGAAQFALMKPEAILVNTCRGPVVDEDALLRALTQKQIAGAGLDVFVEEPPKPNHPLFALPNVTLSPHSAGPTWENWTARFRHGVDNTQRVASGKRPSWVVPELAKSDG